MIYFPQIIEENRPRDFIHHVTITTTEINTWHLPSIFCVSDCVLSVFLNYPFYFILAMAKLIRFYSLPIFLKKKQITAVK